MTLTDTAQCWQNISSSFTHNGPTGALHGRPSFPLMNPVLLLHHSMEACLDMEGWKEVGSKEEWQQGKEACIQKDEIS